LKQIEHVCSSRFDIPNSMFRLSEQKQGFLVVSTAAPNLSFCALNPPNISLPSSSKAGGQMFYVWRERETSGPLIFIPVFGFRSRPSTSDSFMRSTGKRQTMAGSGMAHCFSFFIHRAS
jgi:hypothetical protein